MTHKYLKVYVAGAYRGKTEDDVFENIMTARRWAKSLWEAGYAVICPHLNSMFMGGIIDDQEWIERDLALLHDCDIIAMLPNYQLSKGAMRELEYAVEHDIATIYLGGADE